MAIAIHKGTNKKKNCIHYIKALADGEREKVEAIYQNNMAEQEMKNERLSFIIEKFESLNASIEAARAGELGKGFAVVASEIRGLASSTKELIDVNDEQAETILPKIKTSIDLIKKLVDSIYILNEGIVNIVSSTEEISSQSDTICAISDDIKNAVNEL